MQSSKETFDKARLGDNESMGKLIEENSGLIWSIVKRFFGRGIESDDLYQLGCVGFIKAVQGFDDSFCTQFSTYAVPKIAGEVRRFIRDNGSIKVSRTIKEQGNIIRQAKMRLEQRLGREPTLSELSSETNISTEDIASCELALAPSESLEDEKNDGGMTLENVIGDKDTESKLIEKISLSEAIGKLPLNYRQVLILRYYRDLTQAKTADALGISQVQVSRIEKKAILCLKDALI